MCVCVCVCVCVVPEAHVPPPSPPPFGLCKLLTQLLGATAGAICKPTKDDKGDPVPNSEVISIRQKIYNRRDGAKYEQMCDVVNEKC